MSEKSEKKMEDFITRPYQQAIIDVCIDRNSIVYLPTGAGKSYIAIQVIKHFSRGLEKKYSDGGKRSIFLVNTVCLAKQQAETLQEMTSFNTALLCGELNVDYWSTQQWSDMLDNNEILVSTAQVILDAVKHGFLQLKQVNVIVFDECHHGTKDHPYHELMKMFKDVSIEGTRIIGLSGMLIGNDNKIKPHSVSDALKRLEGTFQSTVVTVNNLDDYKNVLMCSTNASEGLVSYNKEPSNISAQSINQILKVMEEKLVTITFDNYVTIHARSLRPTGPKKVKDLVAFFKDFGFQTIELGPYGGYLSLLSTLIQLELIKRTSDSEKFRNLVRACITTTECCIDLMHQNFGFQKADGDKILAHSSHKVQQLFTLLRTIFAKPDREKDLQCLIFVERRSTAKGLYHALKAYAKQDSTFPIIPDFMVGINAGLPESIEAVLSTSFHSLTLEKFRNKEINCIVSTNVLEEGIDLQMCNLVVAFDAPKTYRSYVQARGRARVDKSDYVVLQDNEDKNKFQNKVITWRNVDTTLKDILVMKTIDREPPSKEDIEREQMNCWEPLITPISKSVLNNLNSVSLLERYANKIVSDRFSNVNLYWRRIDNADGTVSAAVQLPSQSVIKEEIVSDQMVNVKLAKQHAAFKACKILYEAGELNDNLVPIDPKAKVEMFAEEYFPHWEKYKDDKKSAGTRNHRRYHDMKVPNLFKNSAPTVDGVNFLYRINVRPKFDHEGNDGLKQYFQLFANEKEFGILTSRKFPKMCKITLFHSFGEIEVEIDELPSAVTLKTDQDLKVLQDFHMTVFRDVLKTWKPFFVLDKTSHLIVPLTESVQIDWVMAMKFNKVAQPKRLSYDDIMVTPFTRDEYHYRVINPVYRETDQNYVVLKVREDMSPLTPFPHNEYSNYQEYVECKFQVNICKTSQPMLEVKGLSKNLNLFFPGAGKSGKQRKHEKAHLLEHYIPELCHNYKFPADYWLKATLLPSVLHRLHYMLLAEELRMWLINEKIDLGQSSRQVYKLDVDYGDYDKRDKSLKELEHENENLGKLPSYYEFLKHLPTSSGTEKIRSRALLMWNRSELPKDIDRNWLEITEVDIDYYCNFLDRNTNKILPTSMLHLLQLNGAPKSTDRSLMDANDRSDIKILQLDGRRQSVQQKDLIKVLTTANAGDVFDMERFEVLGDGFLKFIASLYLYKKHSTWREGDLTTLKGKIVSNRNLFYVGNNFGLSKMIKASQFDANETLPPSVRLPSNLEELLDGDMKLLIKLLNVNQLTQDEISNGRINEDTLRTFTTGSGFAIQQDDQSDDDGVDKSMLTYLHKHFVGDKIVADAVEAFLGVVVQSLGIEAGLKLCLKLGILPNEDLCALLTEKIPPRGTFLNLPSSGREARVQNQKELEKIIGYKFNDSSYLVQAMTHSSYPIQPLGTYQQLEFLGDAVLDFLVTSYITEQCPIMDPGRLTDLRSALVNNVTLACIIVRNGLHKFLMSENSLLSETIKSFVMYQTKTQHKVVLDQIALLETEDDLSSAEAIDVPKVIGDIFESIVGAVYLDSGMNLTTTWKIIYGLLKQELHEFIANVPLQIIRQLFEYEKGVLKPEFYATEEIDEITVGVPLVVEWTDEKKERTKKVFLGIGKNRVLAKKCAAKLCLRELQNR